MKKIAILTSILALAACGGGSGGGGSGATPVVPDTPSIGENTTTPDTPNTDGNAGVNGGGNTTNPDLPELPDFSAETFTPVDGITLLNEGIKMIVQDGVLVGLETNYDWHDPETDKDVTLTERLNITPNTNTIASVEIFDEDGNLVPSQSTTILKDGSVYLFGKKTGLQFAEFGAIKYTELIPGWGTESISATFTGMNPNKIIENVQGAKVFTGTAVAAVISDKATITDGVPTAVVTKTMVTDTDKASLIFDGTTGNYTLDMDFTKANGEKWYRLTFEKFDATNKNQVTISNSDNVVIAADFVLKEPNQTIDATYNAEVSSIQFAGENGTATEAIVQTHIYDMEGSDTNYDDHSIFFEGAFGGKLQQ